MVRRRVRLVLLCLGYLFSMSHRWWYKVSVVHLLRRLTSARRLRTRSRSPVRILSPFIVDGRVVLLLSCMRQRRYHNNQPSITDDDHGEHYRRGEHCSLQVCADE